MGENTRIISMIKGWRTRIINGVALIIPILSMTEVITIIPVGYTNYYLAALAVINLVLRELTSTRAGQSE